MRKTSLLLCATLLFGSLFAGAGEPPERFRGWLASIGGPALSTDRTWVRLHADTYTDDETVMNLATVLAEKGEDALIKAMRELPPAGWISIGSNTRLEVRVIRSVGGEGARIVRFLTDRPIQFAEMWNATRSRDYKFGFVELVLDGDGEGEGTIIPTAQITLKDGTVEITSLGLQPFRILQVRPEKVK
jgi:hypothetical protein